MKIWVTKNNQAWAADITGLSSEEIKRRYEEARKEKVICTIDEAYGVFWDGKKMKPVQIRSYGDVQKEKVCDACGFYETTIEHTERCVITYG